MDMERDHYRDGYVHGYAHAAQHMLLASERGCDMDAEAMRTSQHLLTHLARWRVAADDGVATPPMMPTPGRRHSDADDAARASATAVSTDTAGPATFLRTLAQTDYDVDGHLLPDGMELMRIARDIHDLTRQRHRLSEILAEMRCRVAHGAASGGHLEAILAMAGAT